MYQPAAGEGRRWQEIEGGRACYWLAMAEYIIFFNQQWVGDHPEEWYAGRGELCRAVMVELKAAGAYVFAGGLVEELEEAFSVDPTSGATVFKKGPFSQPSEYLGGFTVIRVEDEAGARLWAGKIAEACGWPQEVRRFK